jgi:hypothetical protein
VLLCKLCATRGGEITGTLSAFKPGKRLIIQSVSRMYLMRVVLLAVILLLSSGGYTTATCYFFNRLRLVTGFYMSPEHTPVGAFTQIGAFSVKM